MMKKIPFFIAVSLFLCSCGLIGPLYLPDIQSFIEDIKVLPDNSIEFSIRTDEINTTYNPQGIILSYHAADDAEDTSFDLANNHVLFSGNRELNIQQDLKEPVTYITLQFAINNNKLELDIEGGSKHTSDLIKLDDDDNYTYLAVYLQYFAGMAGVDTIYTDRLHIGAIKIP